MQMTEGGVFCSRFGEQNLARWLATKFRFLALAAALACPLLNTNAASLHVAARDGNLDEVNRLIANGADVHAKAGEFGHTPLHYATAGYTPYATEVVNALLAAGADVNAKNDKGRTPLYFASFLGSESTVEALLIAGANVHDKDNGGEMPLHWAGSANNASRLIIAGADVDAKDNNGKTPLHLSWRNADVANALIAAGADVNTKDNNGETLLHDAIQKRTGNFDNAKLDEVNRLIATGVNVNAKDNKGRTPLHRAIDYEYGSIVEALLAAGANVNAKDDIGHSHAEGTVLENPTRFLKLFSDRSRNVFPNRNARSSLLASRKKELARNLLVFSIMKFSDQMLLLVLFSFGKFSSIYAPNASAADGPDAVVRRSLEIALGKSLGEAITREDLARVNHLSFRRHFRINLTLPIGLTNLNELEIFDNTLTSLVLPADLKNLEFLSIQNNQLPALTLPEGLENLTHLYLRGNSIASLSLPDGLSRLRILDISRVDSSRGCARRSGMLQSLTLPEGMTRLSHLYLYGNSLRYLTLPDDLESLQELDLGGNILREFNLPASLMSLQRLNLSENHLRSFILPEGLTNLKVLDLDLNYNYIGHRRQLIDLIAPFGLDVSNLQVSGFSKTDIARYNPHSFISDPGLQIAIRQASKKGDSERLTAEDLKSLTELDASQSTPSKRPPVRNLQGLEMSANLTSLNLNGNDLALLDLPEGMWNLQTLDLSQNALESLLIPEKLASLRKLNLSGNPLNSLALPLDMDIVNLQLSGFSKTDIARYNPHSLIPDPGLQIAIRQALGKGGNQWRIAAEDLRSLTELDASQSTSSQRPPVRNLQGLEMAANLTSLNLNGNGLTSLILPAGWANLKTLNLSRNSLQELALPSDLANLETLYLDGNDLSELALPQGITNLKTLSIRYNRLRKLTLPADLTRLVTLNLVDNHLTSLTLPEGMPQLRRLYLNGNPVNRLAMPQGRNIDNLRISGFSKADVAFYNLETIASETLAIVPL